jgi:hypothetical protein
MMVVSLSHAGEDGNPFTSDTDILQAEDGLMGAKVRGEVDRAHIFGNSARSGC